MTTADNPDRALADLDALIGDFGARRKVVKAEIANLRRELEAIDARLVALMAEQRQAVRRSGL